MKRCCIILCGFAVISIIIIAVVLSVTLTPRTTQFRNSFIAKCENFTGGYDCQQVWDAFEQAYVGRDKCDVPVKAYDPLFAVFPFRHDSSKTLLWSKTKRLVNKYKKRGFVPLGNTMLGAVTEGYDTWCGKKGSKDTFTYFCPGQRDCKNNPVRSYWETVSAKFTEYAQGEVTALLSGSIETPFDPESTLAKIEVPALKPGRVTRLNVVLVTQKNSNVTCENPSLNNLSSIIQSKGIAYTCTEMPESQI